MFGSKARRIAELEAAYTELRQALERTIKQRDELIQEHVNAPKLTRDLRELDQLIYQIESK